MKIPIVFKELKDIAREKTFTSTLLLQIFLITFYSLAIMGILMVYAPARVGYGSIDAVVVHSGVYPQIFIETLEANGNFRIQTDTILDNFKHDIVVYYPNLPEDTARELILQVYVKNGTMRSNYVINEIKQSFLEYEEKLRSVKSYVDDIYPVRPMIGAVKLDESILTVYSLIFEFKYLLMVPLLLFLPIYLSGTLFIDLYTEEIEKKTLMILSAAPIKLKQIINQKIFAALILSIIQIVAWMIILDMRGVHIADWLFILPLLFIINILVLMLSAIIAVYTKNRAVAQVIFSMIMIILLLSKGIIYNPVNIITRMSVLGLEASYYVTFFVGVLLILITMNFLINRKINIDY